MCKDFMNYSEELNDSLILTACETRLRIYNRIEAEMKYLVESEKKKFSYEFLEKLENIKRKGIYEVSGMFDFLQSANQIGEDERIEAEQNAIDKFYKLKSKYAQEFDNYRDDFNRKIRKEM